MESVELLRLLDELKDLRNRLEEYSKIKVSPQQPYQSTEIKELAVALAKAQGEYEPVLFNRENPYFKNSYADLHAIMDSVRKPLAKNGLSFIQQTQIDDSGATMLHTRLMHSSGQWLECRTRIVPPKNDVQSYGSTLTYQKRYAAQALLGITIAGDKDDDDGEIAVVPMRETFAKGTALNTNYNAKIESKDCVTREQIDELEYELAEFPDICEMVLDGLKIQSLADMPKSKYQASVTRIREIKNARKGVK